MSDNRERQVLTAALATFARHGYRKTSMDDVARAADISRPGLYFLFSTKENLFRAAIRQALEGDLAAAERALDDPGRPLRDRVIEAFDAWAGPYVGAVGQELSALLGSAGSEYPGRFAALVVEAIGDEDVARTLLSASRGIKQEVATREQYLSRLTVAVDLLFSGRAARRRGREEPERDPRRRAGPAGAA